MSWDELRWERRGEMIIEWGVSKANHDGYQGNDDVGDDDDDNDDVE